MAYDETLATRVRANLANRSDVAERRMFGGLAFMLSGNMCCCVTEHGLMVRVGPRGLRGCSGPAARGPDGPDRAAHARVGVGGT